MEEASGQGFDIAWQFPARQDDEQAYAHTHIAEALQVLLMVEDADALGTLLEQRADILLSRYTLTTLYLTAVSYALASQEELAQELSQLLHLLGSVQRYGLEQTLLRLAELADEEQVLLLSPADLVQLFTEIRDTLERDEQPNIQVTLFLEIGDQQALLFDETQEQTWLEQATENYTIALSLETREKNPVRWGYIHMRRGIVGLYRQGEERADSVEQAIADLEAALSIDFAETEPQWRSDLNRFLGQAYNARVHGQRFDNVRRAIAAYRAALNDLPLATVPYARLAILQELLPLQIELREEQAARRVFSEIRETAHAMERLARERLEDEKQPPASARQEPLDRAEVDAILTEWLGLSDRDQLFAFLVEHQDTLVSDTALARLRSLLTAKETSEQDGRAEHISSLLHLLEEAQAFSIEVAWPRYLLAVLPAVEEALLLSLAPTFPEVNRRILAQRDLFSSSTMLATLYMLAQAPQNDEYALQDIHQLIALLKKLRTADIPPDMLEDARRTPNSHSSSAEAQRSDGDEQSFVPKPANLGRLNLNDPYFRLFRQELPRVPAQHQQTFASLFMQITGATSNAYLTDFGKTIEQLLPAIDRQQTPYLWATLHMGSAFSAFSTSPDDPQPALAHCEAALSVLTQETAPTLWGRLLLARAALHMEILQGDAGQRFSEREYQEHYQQALQDLSLAETHFSQRENPFEWAMVRATRGMALAEEAERLGLTQDRFRQIILDFDTSLPVITRHGGPWQRILLHMRRANVLYHYRQGNRQATIARVLEDSGMVITLAQSRSSQRLAEVWADALIIHALASTERIDAAPNENAAQALKDLDQALSVYTRATHPQNWALILVNRGAVSMFMDTGDPREHQESALRDFDDAISVLKTGHRPKYVGQALVNRSLCLMRRIAGEKTQNQRKALEDCNEALTIFHQEGFRYDEAEALINRAGILMQLLAGERRENFLRAEADCSAALEIFTPTEAPQGWAKALSNRGMARRGLAASTALNQRGVGIRTFVQRFFTQHSESILAMLKEAQNLIEQALSDFSEALNILTRDSAPMDWARVLRERAIAYAIQAQGYLTGEREKNTRQGIFDLDNALSVFSRYATPYEWAVTIGNRAVLYGELADMGRPDGAVNALADTEAALTIMTRQAAPANYCRLHFLRSSIFIELKEWSQAHTELLKVREAQRDLVASAPGSQEQTDIIAEFALADIYARDAWTLLQIEPVDHRAIAIALEEGRALVARMAFDLDTIRLATLPPGEARTRMADFLQAHDAWRQLQQRALLQQTMSGEQDLSAAYDRYLQARKRIRELDNPDFMTPVPTMQQISQALSAPDEALVYLVAGSPFTSIGGMAVVVTRNEARTPQVNSLILPDLQELRLFDLFEEYDGKTPRIDVEKALEALGNMGLNQLTTFLSQQGITKVRLIPYSWLGLFPLPSLLVTAPNGQRRHLSELFREVTVVPSARSLQIARQGMQAQNRQQRRALLIAGSPEPHPPQEDLPFALAEASAIRRIARQHGHPEAHICYIPPREISRERLMQELPHARYAHLALHAEYCAGDPRSSRLILANIPGANRQGRNIYLGEVLDGAVDLHGMRLLALSACETSVIDMQRVPNEALGLAAGFLQAGATGVLASLWPVNDAATFLLMTRFAQFYLDPQNLWSPAAALAAAQYWLRAEATNLVLSTYDPALPIASSWKLRSLSYEAARQKIRWYARQQQEQGNAEALPYADPFFWAGFIIVGL